MIGTLAYSAPLEESLGGMMVNMEDVLIERDFDEPVSYDTFKGASARDPGCLARYRVTYHGSYVALSDKKMICHARAPDAESVRTPSRITGAPFSRIWTADMISDREPCHPLDPASLVPGSTHGPCFRRALNMSGATLRETASATSAFLRTSAWTVTSFHPAFTYGLRS